MERRNWKVWVAGIALVQLLVIGSVVAAMWPDPTEAERKAALIRVGMTLEEADAALGGYLRQGGPFRGGIPTADTEKGEESAWAEDDGSILYVTTGIDVDFPITEIRAERPDAGP